ncbi:DUF5105 domain-containing protein [Bacillus zhangzhouensis]|uniref:DUF5105 domain-containing protein n=1 Tax=Bacillus zhangzhouensis TaxID=1178540 RepID=UPI002E1C1AD6|nr:DUF5105 domain-containing protein [Bacillus zhangzhouensis]
MIKKTSVLVMIALMMIFSAACQSSVKTTDSEKKSSNTVEVKVNSYEYNLPDDASTTLRENELVLKVNLTITNKENKPLSLLSRHFTLYQGDSQVSELDFYSSKDRLNSTSLNKGKSVKGSLYFLVDKGAKYQLVYQNPINKDSDPIEIDLDGKKIIDTAEKLNNAAKALNAYTDVIVFGKENKQFPELTGDNKADLVNKYNEMFIKDFRRSASIYGNEVSDEDILSMYQRIQNTVKEKAKVETSVKAIKNEEAEVAAKVTGIDASELEDKLADISKEFYKGKITKKELYKKSLKIYASEFEKLPPASSPTEFEVKMKRNGEGQWKIDLNDFNTKEYMNSFIITE